MSLSASHKPHCATHRYGGGPCDCGTEILEAPIARRFASRLRDDDEPISFVDRCYASNLLNMQVDLIAAKDKQIAALEAMVERLNADLDAAERGMP